MRCVKCGKTLESDDRFCSECGTVNPDFYRDNNNTDKTYISDIGLPKKNGDNNSRYSYYDNYGPSSAAYSNDQKNGQTVSPYADDPDGRQNAPDKNIPPVYSSEKNTALGFSGSTPPASGKRKALKKSVRTAERKAEQRRINEAQKNKKNNKGKKKLPLIALALTACIGFACAAGFAFGSSNNKSSDDSGFYTKSKKPAVEEYDFNPLNDIKEPEVIWETDNIKISTRRMNMPYSRSSYAKLQLQIENKTNEKLHVSTSKVLINGCDLDSHFFCYPEAGNIETDSMNIDLKKMAEMNIENINNIDIWFSVDNGYQSNENDRIEEYSDRITIETQNTETDDIYDGPDNMLYDQNGIKIGYYGKEDNRYSNMKPVKLRFYCENDTDLNMDFILKSLSINGNPIDSLFDLDNNTVYSHSRGIFDFEVPQSDFEEWKIKNIHDINEILFTVIGTEEKVHKEIIFNADDLYTKTPG